MQRFGLVYSFFHVVWLLVWLLVKVQKVFVGLLLVIMAVLVSAEADNNRQSNPANPDNTVIRIAVASNFYSPLQQLLGQFPDDCAAKVELIQGASGILYQQIKQGAPYQVFLSADAHYAEQLITEENSTEENSTDWNSTGGNSANRNRASFLYAQGQLVLLLQNDAQLSQKVSQRALTNDALGHEQLAFLLNQSAPMALANPKTAPYGLAATQVLDAMQFKGKRINANNVAHALTYLQTGNVRQALVAKSLLHSSTSFDKTELLVFGIDAHLYAPILQKGVVLAANNTPHYAASQCFVYWLTSTAIQEQLSLMGYQAITAELGESKSTDVTSEHTL